METEARLRLINKISEAVSDYVETQTHNAVKKNDAWKEQYMTCIDELKHELKNSEECVADYKSENLNLNALEQEGYLRALKTMLNTFESYLPEEESERRY
jgi:hypothetical protein